ncbi:hypothetical protein [Chitinophaga filiformis]|uniref:Uncharacterized protein n=1 Tax=Chitinophaga filiformis TaxID=104663 RepID=A0A1G7MKB0_CHIFI|nr:hypothetical protein [Chitinophaga filiformis]SDF61589.1 hypothetical protein SAMN04488121_102449 [Chitinophaga filiformis]
MKKIKLALIALFSVIGVGSIAATSHAPGDYYATPTGGTPLGIKGEDFTCGDNPDETCAYLENQSGPRTRVTGGYVDLIP